MHGFREWLVALKKETAPAILLIFGIGSSGATYLPLLTSLLPIRSYALICAVFAFAWANFRVFQKLHERVGRLQRDLQLSQASVLQTETAKFLERLVSELEQDEIRFLKEVLTRGGRASGADLNKAALNLSKNLYALAVALEKREVISIEHMDGHGYIVGFENRQWYAVKDEYKEALARILLGKKKE